MIEKKFTYRKSLFLGISLLFEFVFWITVWQLLQIFGVYSKNANEQLIFFAPQYAWMFLLIVPLLLLFSYQIYKRNKIVKQLGNSTLLSTFLRPVSTAKTFIRYFLFRNILVFLVFAIMQPAFGRKEINAVANQMEMVFAVDVSNSMNTRDMKGKNSRLSVAKKSILELINQTSPFQSGIIIFAGNAYPQLPLTPDIEMVKIFINELNTNLISNQGTHLAAAINEATQLFTNGNNKKILVIITDGEDHEGGLEAVYDEVKEKNIDTYIVGLGSSQGGLVPKNEFSTNAYLKDESGQAVLSKLNEQMLYELAEKLNGEVTISNDAFPNLSRFLTQINSGQLNNSLNLKMVVKENRYQFPLSLALLLLLTLLVWESFSIKKE